MTETRAPYAATPQAAFPRQAGFLDALRAACPMPVADMADWVSRAEAVGLRLWLRDVRGYLVLAWEQVEARPVGGAGERGKK